MSLRGVQRGSNLINTTTYHMQDCFASLAMTCFWTFYKIINFGKRKVPIKRKVRNFDEDQHDKF